MSKSVIPALYILVGLVSTAAANTEIRLGAAKVDITPDGQVFIAGYGQNRLSIGIHDPIWARCLVLEIGGQRIAFLSLDLIGLFLDDVDAIRKGAASERLPAENIIISCTHNHEGPDTLGLWGPSMGVSGVDSRYKLLMREKATKCVKFAEENLVPGRLRVGQTRVEGVSKNARDENILDPTLIAIKFEDEEGGTIATLINFANHPEALGSKNTLISSDWPNYMYSVVEEALGGICILQNGALGGMVTPDVSAHTFEETERIGTETGLEAVECLESAAIMDCSNITHLSTTVEIPMANKDFLALRKAGVITRSFLRGRVRTEVHLVRFGKVEMVTIPGEALPKVGFAIKEHMKADYKVLIGLGNDELGYIIPKEDFDPTKYEESMSVGPRAAPLIEREIASLIEGVRSVGLGAGGLLFLSGVIIGGIGVSSILISRVRKG